MPSKRMRKFFQLICTKLHSIIRCNFRWFFGWTRPQTMQMMFNFTVIRLAFCIGISKFNPITHRGYFFVRLCVQNLPTTRRISVCASNAFARSIAIWNYWPLHECYMSKSNKRNYYLLLHWSFCTLRIRCWDFCIFHDVQWWPVSASVLLCRNDADAYIQSEAWWIILAHKEWKMNESVLISVIPNETQHLLDFCANTFQLIRFDQSDQWQVFGTELQRANKRVKRKHNNHLLQPPGQLAVSLSNTFTFVRFFLFEFI